MAKKEHKTVHNKKFSMNDVNNALTEEEKMSHLLRMVSVVNDSNDAIILQDFEGKILAWNRGAHVIYGYTEAEAMEMNINNLVAESDRKAALTLTKKIKQGELVKSFELKRTTKDGRILDVWLTITLLNNEKGKPIGIATTERDITDRKQKEKDLKKHFDHLEELVEERTEKLELEITERKQAEEITKKALGLLKTAEKLAHIGSWEWDIREDTFTMSDEWLQIHGVTNRNLMMSELMSIAHPDDVGIVEKNFKDALDGVRPYDIIHRIIRQDNGEERVVNAKGIVSFDKKGKPYRVIGSAQDITEKVKSEQILKESEEKYRSLVEGSLQGMVVALNDPLRIAYASSPMETISGYSPEEIESFGPEELTELIYKDDRESFFKGFADRIAGKYVEPNIKCRLNHKDGRVRWIELYSTLIQYNNEPATQTAFVDITEQKEAEIALTESRDLLRSVIENVPIRVFWKDIELRYLGCNSAFAHDAGMSHPEDLLGKDDFQMGWSEQAELYRADDQLVIDSGKPKIGYEEPQTTPDGQTIWLRSSKVPLHDVKGKVIGVLCIYDDITERKQAEQAISLSNKRYKSLFNDSPIPLWEEDFTELSSYLLELKEKGHKDLRNYFESNPNELMKCAGMIKILDVNQATLDLHKAKSKEQLIGNLSEIFTENSYTVFKDELLAVFEGKEIFESEGEVKTLQGDLKNIYITLKIDQSQPDKVKALLATSDITERKQAEELLLINKNRLEYALNSIKTGAWELDLETMGSWRMFKHDQIFGYNEPLDDWTYDMFLEHVIPEDREIVNQKFQHAIATKTDWNFECRIKRNNDGKIRWIWANGNQEFDGGQESVKMFGIVQDITERKQVEQDLFDSNELFRIAFNQQFQFMAVLSPEGRVLEINELPLEMQGGKREEIIGKYFWEIPTWENSQEWQGRIKKQIREVAAMEETLLTEDSFSTIDGNTHTALAAYTAIRDKKNNVRYILVQATDITERKQAEDEVRKHQEHLEKLVMERTKNLEEKNIELEKFNDLFVGREFRIKELREKVEELETKMTK